MGHCKRGWKSNDEPGTIIDRPSYYILHKPSLHTQLDPGPLVCKLSALYPVASLRRLCSLAPGTLTLPRAEQVLTGACFFLEVSLYPAVADFRRY